MCTAIRIRAEDTDDLILCSAESVARFTKHDDKLRGTVTNLCARETTVVELLQIECGVSENEDETLGGFILVLPMQSLLLERLQS